MIPSFKTTFKTPERREILFWGFLMLALLPWLMIRGQQSTHSDILWLAEALNRVFDGHSMVQSAYETNPPISLLLYTLPVWLHRAFDWPLHYTVFAQSLGVLGICLFMLRRALDRFVFLGLAEKYCIVFTYALASTLAASLLFGERDQLIAMVLPPFVLTQIALTYALLRPRATDQTFIDWGFLAFGAFIILLKPHHGLIPALLLLHRVLKNRNLSALRDPDFLALAGMVAAYAVVLWLGFRDYLTVILPDVLNYYVMTGQYAGFYPQVLMALGLIGFIMAVCAWLRPAPAVAAFSIFLLGCAVLSMIPVVVQNKGFYYHYLPVIVFSSCAAAHILYLWLVHQSGRVGVSMVLCLSAITLFAYGHASLNPSYPTHATYQSLPFSKILRQCADDKQCTSFFMFNSDMGLMHEAAYYLGLPHISRFPALWFLPKMTRDAAAMQAGELSPARADKLKADMIRFSGMVADDLESGQPEIVFILPPDEFAVPVDLLGLFSVNPRFRALWSRYKKSGTVTLDYNAHYGNALKRDDVRVFDVYRLKTQ